MCATTVIRRVHRLQELIAITRHQLSSGEIQLGDLANLASWKLRTLGLRKPVRISTDASDQSTLLQIADVEFWWPTEYSLDVLDLVWAEVFLPFPPNGHAYEYQACTITPGDWVLDAGACEGFFVHYALGRGASLVAVEPVARLAHCLRKTFSHAQYKARVMVVNALLGEKCEQGRVGFDATPISARSTGADGDEVPVTTIDELIRQGVAPRFDFIKMDIEGSEPNALRGAGQTLVMYRPRISACVYHAHDHERQIRGILEDAKVGYEIRLKGLARNGSRFVRQVLHASATM
jgi:FkbM family methyltransferase